MDIYKERALQVLSSWFKKAPNWQADLFCGIWNGKTDDALFNRCIKLIEQEYLLKDNHLTPETTFPKDFSLIDKQDDPVTLIKIENVKGVGALSATTPLEFSDGLTVVYGENGCGKSSYVRILKSMEAPENSVQVFGNVFHSQSDFPEATITLSEGTIRNIVVWKKNSRIKYPLQVYDTATAQQFVDKENEVIYEPMILAIITRMALIQEQVSAYFKEKEEQTYSEFSPLPKNIITNRFIAEFKSLKTHYEILAFMKKHPWSKELDDMQSSISLSLKETNPQEVAQKKQAQLDIIRRHGMQILSMVKSLTQIQCEEFIRKKTHSDKTQKTAEMLTIESQKYSILPEFGSIFWDELWHSAVKYIKSIDNSREVPFSADLYCALCQQKLDTSSVERLTHFKEFVTSDIKTETNKAQKEYRNAVDLINKNIIGKCNLAEIEVSLQSTGIPLEIQNSILLYYRKIFARANALVTYDGTVTVLPDLESEEHIIGFFKEITDRYRSDIKTLEAVAQDRDKQISYLNDLDSIFWINNNMHIKELAVTYKSICNKSRTNSITTLKKDLSTLLITDSYINKFQEEMTFLDSKAQIKVELVAKAPRKGKCYHQISLKGACAAGKHTNKEILSEGEFRVVSLAAFLADLSSWRRVMPFIFDDPITSLDQKFEERVAKRLVKLSTERQVIVFTHRLAFAQLLNKSVSEYNGLASKNEQCLLATIRHVELRNEPLGQPSNASYLQKISMDGAIKKIKNEDIAQVKKLQASGNYELADTMLQALAARFRNLVELGIEHNLLQGIVSRFGLNISSQKLPYLLAMTRNDIELFQHMMTKYSYYDHSQSVEITVPTLNIDDFEKDLEQMSSWVKEYQKRCEKERDKFLGKTKKVL